MKIKTWLPAFTSLKLSNKKYVFVDQDGYIRMNVDDFLIFYRSIVPYMEYVEDVSPEYYEKLSLVLPKNKIITKSLEEGGGAKQDDALEKEQSISDESSKTEQSPTSNNEETEKPRRRRGSK